MNIANFLSEHLTSRHGADADTSNLMNLFTQLRFQVEVHRDVTAETMESLLLTMSLVDHSEYDALVCCILTHGKLGVVYTSDGREVEILSIANFFTDSHCSTLRGKPKLFFIQACQSGDDSEGSHQQPASNQQRNLESGPVLHASDAPNTAESDIPREILSDVKTATKETEVMPEMLGEVSSTSGLDHITSVEHSQDSGYLSVDADPFSPEPEGNNAGMVPETTPVLMRDNNRPLKYKSRLIPGHPDFLMSYSTLPGSFSYRDPIEGCLYIQALVANLKSGHEIDRCLKMVTESVRRELIKKKRQDNGNEQQKQQQQQQQQSDRFQLPFHLTSGMTKLIYL